MINPCAFNYYNPFFMWTPIPPVARVMPRLSYEDWAKKYHRANIKVINNVAESFAWKKEFISSAESSIELSANFAGGKDFIETLALIERRMKEKPRLRTHILLSEDFLEPKDKKALERLQKKFKARFTYLITGRKYYAQPFVHTQENHVKMLVVDEKYFIIGGSGICPAMTRESPPTVTKEKKRLVQLFIASSFRDTDLIGEGVTASIMRRHFFDLFDEWEQKINPKSKNRFFHIARTGISRNFLQEPAIIKDAKIKFVSCGPHVRDNNPITQLIAKRILCASREVHIASLFFNPHPQIKCALAVQRMKRLHTVGYFNGSRNNKKHLIHTCNSRPSYNLLSRVYEFEKPDCLYHKKVMTVDGKYAVIGSYNLGQKSALCDNEIVVQIKDARAVAQVHQGLREDAKSSTTLTGQQLHNHRFRVLERPLRFLAPLYV